jgi:hypothetical protein
MVEPSIPECFRLLKLRRGTDFADVKQAYRRNLNKCHPDLFQGRPELIPVAEQKTKRLVQVYGILERWYEENGGIDPVSPGGDAAHGSAPAQEESPFAEKASSNAFRLRVRQAAIVAVLVAVGIYAWQSNSGTAEVYKPATAATAAPIAAEATAVVPTPNVQQQPGPLPSARAQSVSATAELDAMVAERDRVRSAWVAGFMHDRERERDAAKGEYSNAQDQYESYIRDHASEIKEAQDETTRQVDQAKRVSAAARDAFAKAEPVELEAMRHGFDNWLLDQGKQAVALVQEIRRRENSDLGVFSDTEDPTKIFEFWTAEEAGGPEVSIAAKTGVAVLQPDARFFPHFRSNIFLYNPEGQVLVRMMGSIVEKHDALLKDIGDKEASTEATLANWDDLHPIGTVQLSSSLRSVMDGRESAADRMARARIRLDGAALALNLSRANGAFALSPDGKKWTARIAAAQSALELAKGGH